MFNLQPGQGLGFSGSKEIAFGLGSSFATPYPLFISLEDAVEYLIELSYEGGGA